MEAKDVEFSPAANGNKGESIKVENFYFPENFKTEGESKYDFAILELGRDLSGEYGFLGIDSDEENIEKEEEIEICGYPG